MKKLSFLFVLAVLVFTVAGCDAIDDLNGEADTSLSQITIEELYGKDVQWSASNLKTKSSVSHSGILPNSYYAAEGFTEELDKDNYQMQCGSASGITNLIAVRLEAGESVTINVESQIDQGNLELVLLKRGEESHEFIYQFETDGTDSYSLSAENFGIYYVRAGLESFGGSIEVTRSFGK